VKPAVSDGRRPLCGFRQNNTMVPVGSSTETISLLTVGCLLLLAFGINEGYTKRSPIVPPWLFKVGDLNLHIHIRNFFFRHEQRASS